MVTSSRSGTVAFAAAPSTSSDTLAKRACVSALSMREFPVQDVTLTVSRAGVALSQRFRLSYWDGAILAAAQACGCDAVYSEDLSDQQDYEGLRVISPFRERGRRR